MPPRSLFAIALGAALLLLGAAATELIQTPAASLIAAAAALVLLALAAAAFARRSEQRLHDLEHGLAQQRAIAEHGPDAMWVFHVESFQLIDVNENLLRLVDRPREDVIGKTPMDLSAPIQEGVPSFEYARALIERVLQGEKVVAPWMIRTRNGEDIPCEVRGVYLPARGKTLICGSMIDVRERLRQQNELARRHRFEALINRLSSSLTELTAESLDAGIEQALAEIGTFAEVDRSYIFVFDDTRTLISCTHEWCAPGVEAQITRLQELPIAVFQWAVGRLLAGEVVHVPRVSDVPPEGAAERTEWEAESIQSLLMVPIRTQGVTGFVGFDAVQREKNWSRDDIDLLRIFGAVLFNTRLRLMAEAALRQKNESLARANAELEISNVELQQFAYIASHDLQEPLRTIASFSELLDKRYGRELDDDGRSFLGYVGSAARRLHALINDLLDYSRIESRSRPFERCDLNEVLRSALHNLAASIRDANAVISNDRLPTVNGDPSQLMQVFQNLIGNALKFHAEHSSPEIHVGVRHLREGDWQFSIRDNGIGLDPADLRQLFQVFRRLHTADKYPGTGIGLASCKRIVERHHGRIWAAPNTSGPGATFHFTLPGSPPANEAAAWEPLAPTATPPIAPPPRPGRPH